MWFSKLIYGDGRLCVTIALKRDMNDEFEHNSRSTFVCILIFRHDKKVGAQVRKSFGKRLGKFNNPPG